MKQGMKMWAIMDSKTGRYLNKRSIEIDGNELSYVTYSGKIGTDFAKVKKPLEEIYQSLQKRNTIGKSLEIVTVNPDLLPVGKMVLEVHTIS